MLSPGMQRAAARWVFKLPEPALALAGGRSAPVDGFRLDPATAVALAAHRRRGAPALESLAPAEAREEYKRQLALFRGRPRPMRALTELRAPGPAKPISVRLYHPRRASRPAPLLVYFHGGGGVIGDLDAADSGCRMLADESGCLVASVAYRLAPEHPFPAGLEDALAAYRWIANAARDLGAAPDRLAVGGDSLGANLATNVARAMAGQPRAPRFQLLIYPSLDLTGSRPSRQTFAEGYLLTRSLSDWFKYHYLPDPGLANDPRVSPLWATDLAGSAPALVITAGFDPLRDEGRAYADRLEDAGVAVRYVCHGGLVHGFLSAVDVIGAATAAARDAAHALRHHLAQPCPRS
jgi:acetyl esterase